MLIPLAIYRPTCIALCVARYGLFGVRQTRIHRRQQIIFVHNTQVAALRRAGQIEIAIVGLSLAIRCLFIYIRVLNLDSYETLPKCRIALWAASLGLWLFRFLSTVGLYFEVETSMDFQYPNQGKIGQFWCGLWYDIIRLVESEVERGLGLISKFRWRL